MKHASIRQLEWCFYKKTTAIANVFVTVSGARELYPVPRATECVFSYCSVFELFYSLSSFWSIKCYEFGKM